MRFCPFCGAENADDSSACTVCARKLAAPVVRKPSVAAGVGPAARPAVVPATGAPAARARTPSIPPPLPAPPLPAPPRVPTPAADRAASVPNGKAIESAARAADASRGTPTGVPLGTPTPTPLPMPRPASRDATESALATRQVQLPEIEEARKHLAAMPAVPDGGPFDAARYAVLFAHARWQRRKAIVALSQDVMKETASLDGVLGELGKVARSAHLEGRVFGDENQAIDEAERRRGFAEQACTDLTGKKADENAKFETISHDLAARLSERESLVTEVSAELARLDGQRRALRDKKKDLDKKQRALLKSASDREEQASASQMGDSRQSLRNGANELRRDSRGLEDERGDVEARLSGLEKPIGDAAARHEQAKGDLESARRDLENAREGHRHRTAEIDAESARRYRELQQAEGEIARRLVTLGTIVNLNRVDKADFLPLFDRCDQLRALISARETEIDRLSAERDAYDRPSVFKGIAVLGVALLVLITLVWILIWFLQSR